MKNFNWGALKGLGLFIYVPPVFGGLKRALAFLEEVESYGWKPTGMVVVSDKINCSTLDGWSIPRDKVARIALGNLTYGELLAVFSSPKGPVEHGYGLVEAPGIHNVKISVD